VIPFLSSLILLSPGCRSTILIVLGLFVMAIASLGVAVSLRLIYICPLPSDECMCTSSVATPTSTPTATPTPTEGDLSTPVETGTGDNTNLGPWNQWACQAVRSELVDWSTRLPFVWVFLSFLCIVVHFFGPCTYRRARHRDYLLIEN
jgi:hypothetical protein